MRLAFQIAGLAAICGCCAATAQAQMFGPRQLGGMLSRQQGPGALSNPAAPAVNNPGGQITGAERFVRGARQATDFIGTDSGDRRGFVGMRQARNRAILADPANGLRPRPEQNLNPAAPMNENGPATMYPPRYTLATNLSGPEPSAVEASLQRHLRELPGVRWTSPLEVTVDGRTAILRGAVASERDRELAEALVQFEPGISEIQNDLEIRSPSPLRSSPVGPAPLGGVPEDLPSPAPMGRQPREF